MVEGDVACGVVIEFVAAVGVPHDGEGGLGLGASCGVVDVGDEEAFDSFAESVDGVGVGGALGFGGEGYPGWPVGGVHRKVFGVVFESEFADFVDGDDLAGVVYAGGAPESVEFGNVAEDVAFVDVGAAEFCGAEVVFGEVVVEVVGFFFPGFEGAAVLGEALEDACPAGVAAGVGGAFCDVGVGEVFGVDGSGGGC